jgi:hypothetical protein
MVLFLAGEYITQVKRQLIFWTPGADRLLAPETYAARNQLLAGKHREGPVSFRRRSHVRSHTSAATCVTCRSEGIKWTEGPIALHSRPLIKESENSGNNSQEILRGAAEFLRRRWFRSYPLRDGAQRTGDKIAGINEDVQTLGR